MLLRIFRFLKKRFLRKSRGREIAPDEIFLDSHNSPRFDTYQLEGQIEKPIPPAISLLPFLIFVVSALIFVGRAGQLQIFKGQRFLNVSESNRLHHTPIFADRGIIFDRSGVELAWNETLSDESFARRRYIDKAGFGHLLGFVKYPSRDKAGVYYRDDYIGVNGVEAYFDARLAGRNGRKIVETDAMGNIKSESTLLHPTTGQSITLSIDSRVQGALYDIIGDTAEKVNFQGGGGVIMDVWTGEILSLVSFPEYKSQVMTDGADAETIESYRMDERSPFLNRPIAGLYVPGSIVKPFLAIAALEHGIIDPLTKIVSRGSLSVENPYDPDRPSVFKDWKAHGPVSMREAIAVSSNVYFYVIGGGYKDQKGLGIGLIEKTMRGFGFGRKTGVNLPGEEAGLVPGPQWKRENFTDGDWRTGDTYNVSIGQYGFQATPLQAASAVAAIANGGKLPRPSVIKREYVLKDADTDAASVPDLTFLPDNLEIVRGGMRDAVRFGTAAGLFFNDLEIAAKTGTAEVGARKQFTHAWAIGFFPVEKPRYCFAVLLERGPLGNLVGGVSVMRRMFEWMIENTPEYVE